MLKTRIFFIISLLFLIVCTGICAPNLVAKTQNFVIEKVSTTQIQNTSDEITHSKNVNTVDNNVKKTKKRFSIQGVSKKLFTFLVVSLSLIAGILGLCLLKIRALLSNTHTKFQTDIDKALNQLTDIQKEIKKNLNLKNISDEHGKNIQQQKELDELALEITPEELEKIEIKTSQKETKKQYTQQEQKYTPIILNDPVLISEKPISKSKGFYVVDCGTEKALIGYIKDEIFVLNKFKEEPNKNIQVRLTEKLGHKYIYLVRNGSFKALVQVEKEKMKVLLEI